MVKTPKDLVEILNSLQGGDLNSKTPENLKYVIYARKSTDEKDKQERSLSDQMLECKKYAESNDLRYVKIVQESISAKEPDIRPKFREILESLKNGKYDGIIAWHPDRLARNMKDAGEIIDLLDKSIIKDLRFPSFTFDNTTSGKMLLGMAFVLSKQYSDKLSDDVTRGTKHAIEEGKCLTQSKHGYKKDRNLYLRPDGNNHILIAEAWKKRLNGETLDDIADFLNKNDYTRQITFGKPNKRFIMKKNILSKIFKDPIYAGALKYGKHRVDLTDVYDFTPMISVEDYMKLNKYDDIKKAFTSERGISKKKPIKANFLRKMVVCGHCNNIMTPHITMKENKSGVTNYFRFGCRAKGCKFNNKSIRAKVIVDYVNDLFKNSTFTLKNIYKHYKTEAIKMINNKNEELIKTIKSATSKAYNIQKNIDDLKDLLLEENDKEMQVIFKKDIKIKTRALDELKHHINKIKQTKTKSKKAIYTYEQFFELFMKLPSAIAQTKKLEDLDFLIKKLFLNFTIKDKKVASYKLNKPFNKLVKSDGNSEVFNGGLAWI